MKRAFIVHCWGGNPEHAWYPRAKEELTDLGYAVRVPAMPDTDQPQLDRWLAQLQRSIGQPDDQLVLIGHSLGAVTIMRYLESLKDGQHVKRVVLVAGFTDHLGFTEIASFFQTAFDFAKIRAKSLEGFVAIQSDNDPYVTMENSFRLQQQLGVRLVIKHGAFHMSGAIDDEETCYQLPEVIKAVSAPMDSI